MKMLKLSQVNLVLKMKCPHCENVENFKMDDFYACTGTAPYSDDPIVDDAELTGTCPNCTHCVTVDLGN